ncbi:MAG: Ig-like domain-containing protein, partial [Actinomycetota bacterium]|nr:Ig-like domain-containing protein [Actinomycetota bacterium]
KWSEADMSRGAVTPPTHLYGLAKTPTGELWAVGRRDLLTLTEHVCTQAATTTSLVVHPSRPTFGQSVTFTATVAPAGPSSTSPAGTVEFLLDGQAVPVATMDLVGGQASFTTSGLSAGPHTVTARYSGDANYAPSSSAPARITVTTTTRVSGDHPGALTVASGTSVLVANATIGGAVIVQPGGSVDIENSTVASLSAVGPGALRVCGSTVNGSVSVTQALGFVLIGDPGDDGCAANTIGGTVVVQDNHHGVEVIGNHVPAPVVAGANSGAGAFPEDTKPDISGNGPA